MVLARYLLVSIAPPFLPFGSSRVSIHMGRKTSGRGKSLPNYQSISRLLSSSHAHDTSDRRRPRSIISPQRGEKE